MNSRLLRALSILALAAAFLLPVLASAQDDIVSLADPALAPLKKTPSLFEHAKHAEDYAIPCADCHHGATAEGAIDPAATSEGEACSSCHPVGAEPGKTWLMLAFHKQCKGCHETQRKGPLGCGECHVK